MGRLITTESFIAECTKTHKGKYNYSLVEYIGYKNKVRIICPTHGTIKVLPYKHIQGANCFKCANDARQKRTIGLY